jgi:chromosome segregation ATPase
VPPVVVLKPAIAIPPIKHPLVERIAEMERETGRLGELIREREERLRGLESAIVRLSAEADSLRAINTRLEKDAQRTSTELVTADATLRRNREGMRHFQDLFGLFVRQGILEKIA